MEEHIAYISRVEEQAKQAARSNKQEGNVLGLLLGPENGACTYLQNVDRLRPD
jgi:hypothetical protein